MIIDGVDRYRVCEPMFEGVRVILSHRGEKHTPAYIQGISGAAFRISGICPCAPTCSSQMDTQGLIKLLGHPFTHELLGWKGDDVAGKMQALIPQIKDSIRAGRPVLVWHAFTNAEWDVVAGFDDTEGAFLGRCSYKGMDAYAKAKQTRPQEAVNICPAFGAIFVGDKTGKLDAPAAEIAALREAVRHARDKKNVDKVVGEKWVQLEGLAAYGRWVDDFRKPDYSKGPGDSYCQNIYRSTHRAGSEFLRAIAPRHPRASKDLLAAATSMAAEADTLDAAERLIGWQAPKSDPKRNEELWPILAAARGHYAAAIDHIEKAVGALA